MKEIPPLIVLILIATTLNIIECSIVNITLKCQISSSEPCLTDKSGCVVVCNMTSGLDYSTQTEVQGFDINKDVKLEQIKSLVIKPFGMTENLPSKIGEKLINLEKFEVVGTKLKYIRNQDFRGMKKLKILNLGSNKIENFPKETFENLTNLEVLFLYGNQINTLVNSTLKFLPNLREFHADMNQLKRIEDNFFKNNPKIEKISLNENQLNYFKENLTHLKNLKFVDLRRNFEWCTSCEIMEKKASDKRFDDCERDNHKYKTKLMLNFEECVKIKISEKDEYLKKFNKCAASRDVKLQNITRNFETCGKIDKHPITIDNIKTIDGCIFNRLKSEDAARLAFDGCVRQEIQSDENWATLIGNCALNRTIEATAIKNAYDSCIFCKNMLKPDNIKMCELRYVKDYNDDLNAFNADVLKFFDGTKSKNIIG